VGVVTQKSPQYRLYTSQKRRTGVGCGCGVCWGNWGRSPQPRNRLLPDSPQRTDWHICTTGGHPPCSGDEYDICTVIKKCQQLYLHDVHAV
jgi:hypothetical protein